MKVDSAPVTSPDEGPEQRWRRTVRKRPAKLKLGRLLRDFGYAELDDDVADAIDARMASVGLAVRPSLREAAADEIVTVYRPRGARDGDARATAAAAAPTPREPAAAPATERPRPKSRQASDPDSAHVLTDLKGQLADARAESGRVRTELDGRIAAMADADRLARERLAEQSAVVADQAHRLATLSGLLIETRAALAEARDEIRRAVGDLPAAVVEAPMEAGGLSEEEGWLTDADEPLPPSPVEAAISAIAAPVDDPDELVSDVDAAAEADAGLPPSHDAPADDLAALPMDDVFAGALDAPPDGDGFAPEADAPAAQEAPGADADAPLSNDDLVFEPQVPAPAEAEAPAEDDVFSLGADAPAAGDGFSPPAEGLPEEEELSPSAEALAEAMFSLEDAAPAEEDVLRAPAEEDVFGPPAEAPPEDEVFAAEPEADPAPETVARPPTPPRRRGFFTLDPQPPPPDADAAAPPAEDEAAKEPAFADERRLVDDVPTTPPPVGEPDRELDVWQVGEAPAEREDFDFSPPGEASDEAVPEPTAMAGDGPSALLPPPPPLPPSPFAGERPASPPEIGERSSKPAKRGRMARGRGRWEGTCSVCERFPEGTRRRDLEAAGWQLDGDFPTCPQCRGLA